MFSDKKLQKKISEGKEIECSGYVNEKIVQGKELFVKRKKKFFGFKKKKYFDNEKKFELHNAQGKEIKLDK